MISETNHVSSGTSRQTNFERKLDQFVNTVEKLGMLLKNAINSMAFLHFANQTTLYNQVSNVDDGIELNAASCSTFPFPQEHSNQLFMLLQYHQN